MSALQEEQLLYRLEADLEAQLSPRDPELKVYTIRCMGVLWAMRFILQRHNIRRSSCRHLGFKPRACVQNVIRRKEKCAKRSAPLTRSHATPASPHVVLHAPSKHESFADSNTENAT
jgi:hypothetical protein